MSENALYIFVSGFRRVYSRRGLYPRGLKSGIIKKRFETRHSIANQNTFYIYWFSIKLQNVTKNRIQEKKSLKGLIYGEVYNRMYFGPITGARAYKWVGELIRGGGGGAYTWCGRLIRVCGGRGGGGYKKQFTVPGLKTTNDVTQKHKGVKITKLRKTMATKLSKTSPIFTPRMTPLFSITYLWLFRSFLLFQFFF